MIPGIMGNFIVVVMGTEKIDLPLGRKCIHMGIKSMNADYFSDRSFTLINPCTYVEKFRTS